MSRYCSITTRQTFSRALNAVSNKLKNQQYEKLVETCLRNNEEKWSFSFWNKATRNISQFHSSLTSESRSKDNVSDIYNKKIRSSKLLRKEIVKLCTNIQKTFSRKEFLLSSAAAVSVVGNDKNVLDNTLSTKIGSDNGTQIKDSSSVSIGGDTGTQINNSTSSLTGGDIGAHVKATEVNPGLIIESIPEPPSIPEGVGEIINQLNANGDPTFASLGLGGYSPVGLVQHCFEYLHCTLGIEWWAAIALGTVIVRLCLFPLVIITQRNAAKMNNYLPQMQLLQMKMTEARQTGNQIDAARYSQELMMFMREKGLNPLKNMLVPLAQMPIFISFFMGLRQMANVPVDSLRTGGIWWFTDLTLPDQYFLLPLITSATLYATIEIGTDTARLSSQNMQFMKYVLRGIPIIILPFTVNFPGAILCYWLASNFVSLAQVGFLRIPTVRDYFKIDPLRKLRPEEMPMKPKGFKAGLKDSWENIKITKELEARKKLDELHFQRAGKGPIVKTYTYDPTKQISSKPTTPISAKNR